jgi:glyceraldehyde 3-phosphate dehydrogenase
MSTNIAINGFGRIGRAVFKAALENKNVQIVAINDLMDNTSLAHLLQYDTVYGRLPHKVRAFRDRIEVGKKKYPVFEERDPSQLPWKEFDVDVVAECTGIFRDKKMAQAHIVAGAKKVIISAPAKDSTQTLVLGTKDCTTSLKSKKTDTIVSNASCTTNSIAPIMQVLSDMFGVEKALLTTIHSYTAGQNLVDGPHKDLRRARAAAHNIVPTTTGAARATGKVVKTVDTKFDGISVRVPTLDVSLSDISVVLKRKRVTEKQINDALKKASKQNQYKGILGTTTTPLVSSDFIGENMSSVVDLSFTKVVGGNLVKILAWYDNEWGYAVRLVELASHIGKSR